MSTGRPTIGGLVKRLKEERRELQKQAEEHARVAKRHHALAKSKYAEVKQLDVTITNLTK